MAIQKKPRRPFQLQGYHHEAIELRYQGKTYAEIAGLLAAKYKKNMPDITVRMWFKAGGVLELHYLDFSKKENDRRRQSTLEELKKIIPKIPLKFDQLLERIAVHPFSGVKLKDEDGKPIPKLDMVTVVALKNLCEMLGFKVTDAGDMTNPVDEYFDRVEKEVQQDEKNI